MWIHICPKPLEQAIRQARSVGELAHRTLDCTYLGLSLLVEALGMINCYFMSGGTEELTADFVERPRDG